MRSTCRPIGTIRPVSSAIARKLGRLHQAVAGPVPAGEGLEALDLAGAHRDRPVGSAAHLAGVEATTERALGLEAGRDRRAQVLVEQLGAVPAPLLGAVGGDVGVLEQRRRDRQLPSATTTPTLAPTNTSVPRTENGASSATRIRSATASASGGATDVGAHDHELVATEAAGRVAFADRRVQPFGHLDEQLVARGVSEAVVHAFEVVEIDEQDRDVARAPARARERELEVVDEKVAQREGGQPVVRRLVREALLELAALGDVDDLAEAVEPFAVGVLHDRHVHAAPDPLAGLALVPLLDRRSCRGPPA